MFKYGSVVSGHELGPRAELGGAVRRKWRLAVLSHRKAPVIPTVADKLAHADGYVSISETGRRDFDKGGRKHLQFEVFKGEALGPKASSIFDVTQINRHRVTNGVKVIAHAVEGVEHVLLVDGIVRHLSSRHAEIMGRTDPKGKVCPPLLRAAGRGATAARIEIDAADERIGRVMIVCARPGSIPSLCDPFGLLRTKAGAAAPLPNATWRICVRPDHAASDAFGDGYRSGRS